MKRPKRSVLLFLLAYFALVGAGLTYYRRMLFADNLHPVVPGEVYRSAQMDADTLADTIEALAIRTVVNLRGDSRKPWYAEETATCTRLGVEKIDIGFDARDEPLPWRLVRLIEVLSDRSKRPLLMHCQAGSDRTGLAAALALIVKGENLDTASGQLGVLFGHFRFTETGIQDRLLERYERWQQARGDAPSAKNLLRWAKYFYIYKKETYDQYGAEVRLEGAPAMVRRGGAIRFVLHAKNTGRVLWHCAPVLEGERGRDRVQVRLRLYRKGEEVENWNRLPLISFTEILIHPGKTFRVDVSVPVDAEPGRYVLHADLIHNNRFSQGLWWPITSGPAEIDLEVQPRAGD